MSEYVYYQKNRVFVKFGHDCELLDTGEEEVKLTLFQRIRKYLNEIRMVSELHHLSDELLRSQGAIMREKERHLLYYPYTIHPFSDFRRWWESFIVFVLFLEFIIIPIDVGYYADDKYHSIFYTYGWILFRNFLDCMLLLDIILNSLTGYYDYVEKEVVLNLPSIFRHYLKTMFIPHLISSVPTDIDLLFTWFEYKVVKSYVVRLELQLFSLLKTLRMHTFWKYLLRSFFNRNLSYIKELIFLTIITMVFYIHTLTCMLTFLSERAQNIILKSPNITYDYKLSQEEYDELVFLEQLPPFHKYVFNMYYATQII